MIQYTPCFLWVTGHGLVKVAPEVAGLLGSSCGRGSRELTKFRLLNLLRRVSRGFQLGLTFVNGVRPFGTEELQRVIAKYIRVGQNFVIGEILLVLTNSKIGVALNGISGAVSPCDGAVQHPFQLEGVVVQNCRCFDPERVQNLTAFPAQIVIIRHRLVHFRVRLRG